MKNIAFIVPCSASRPDGLAEKFDFEDSSIYLLYCRLSSFFSRAGLRLKHFKILRSSEVYPPRFSMGGGVFLPGDGKKLILFHLADIANILTGGDYSNLVIYVDNIEKIIYCQPFFYKSESFLVAVPPGLTDSAEDYIIDKYGAAGIVKSNISYKEKTVISFADTHHTGFEGARCIVCLGEEKHPAAIDLQGVFLTPPPELYFLPPFLCSAPCLEKIMEAAGIGFEKTRVRFIKK
jgi:hypothetical protein